MDTLSGASRPLSIAGSHIMTRSHSMGNFGQVKTIQHGPSGATIEKSPDRTLAN